MATDKEFVDELRRMVNRKKDHLAHRAFKASKGAKNFKTIVIRELDGIDERVVAIRVGELLKNVKDPTMGVVMGLQQKEQWRLSIAAVDGVPTEDGVSPFAAFDKWSQPSIVAVGRYYGELNGLDTDDLEKSVGGSVPVDASRLAEIPAFASDSPDPATEKP